MRMTAGAVVAHSMPFGSSSPTRAPLPTPAGDEPARERAARVVELGVGDRGVVGDERLRRAVVLAPAPARSAGIVSGRRAHAKQLLQRAARRACRSTSSGRRRRRARTKRWGTLYAERRVASCDRELRRRRRGCSAGRDDRGRDELAALGVVDADDVRDEAGDVGDRLLDLARRDVRARGLDHVAAPAREVEEAVGVDVKRGRRCGTSRRRRTSRAARGRSSPP